MLTHTPVATAPSHPSSTAARTSTILGIILPSSFRHAYVQAVVYSQIRVTLASTLRPLQSRATLAACQLEQREGIDAGLWAGAKSPHLCTAARL
eukprot:6195556-Pleurochrysis_carterae.AAC.2